jgi:hypothetical protein
MANNNAPFGFRSFGHRDGSAPTMGLQKFTINSSDTNLYFTGDPVALSGGVLTLYNGSSGTPVLQGIFNGCEYFSPSVGRVVWSSFFPGAVSSSNPVIAYVISDPEMTFVVQGSSTPITSSMVGLNINVLTSQSSLGNQTTGISAVTVASTQVATNSSFPFQIVDLYSNFAPVSATNSPGTDNTSNFNDVIVALNFTARHAGATMTST